MPLDLSVIVTAYDSGEYLGGLLDSLRDLSGSEVPREVIVVDNASRDGSAAIAGSRAGVRLIRSGRNLGLARGNNLGAREASGSSLLFLNPDITVHPGSLEALMAFQDSHPGAFILGPALTGPDGAVQSTARTYPGLLDILYRRTALGRLPGAGPRLRRHLNPAGTDRPSRVDWLVGAALWLTPSGRKGAGLMPENYFLYFEDVEWCWRANHLGGEVWYVPDSVMGHVHRRDSAGRSRRALRHHLSSMVRFYTRHPTALAGSRGDRRGKGAGSRTG
jgi:N-acetylglucosaminyl-diphospho-decaprenol L-rhamnosyltransferase